MKQETKILPDATYTVKASDLFHRIRRVKYAAGQTTDRMTACVRFCGNQLFCMDQSRLAVSAEDTLVVKESFALPLEVLPVLKLFGNKEITLSVYGSFVLFSHGDTICYVRRIKVSDTLRLETVMPKHPRERFTVDLEAYTHTLRQLMKGVKTKRMPPVASICEGRLCRPRQDQQACDIEMEKLQQALKQFEGVAKVQISICNDITPVMITAEGSGDTALVMPIRRRKAA